MRVVPQLLMQIREAGQSGLATFAHQIEEAISSSKPLAPGLGELRPRLLAYKDILEFDRSGIARGSAQNVPEAVVETNELFRFTTRFDVGKALVMRYVARWPKARPLTTLVPFVDSIDAPGDSFGDVPAQDVQIVEKPGAAATFVLFCGMRHSFGTHLNLIHHACMAKVPANVIYVRDFAQSLFLSGIKSLGSVNESCQSLREEIARLGGRRLVCMGMSGGVFGALYYGSMLKADFALVFSGPTSLAIGAEETERQAFARVRELHERGKVDWPDLREIYRQNGIPVSLYFGGQNRVDRLQAENLEGLTNVRLFPQQTKAHIFLDELERTGEFGKLLAKAAEPLQGGG